MISNEGGIKNFAVILTDVETFNVLEIPAISIGNSLTIQDVNQAAEIFIGMSSDVIVGQDYRTILGLEDTKNKRNPVEMVMDLAIPHAGDAIIQINGKAAIPVKYGISPVLDNNGQVNGVINYFVDQRQKGIVGEIDQLATKIQDGNLKARADPLSFDGDARTILEGVNNILDAIIDPLHLTAEYVEKISNGENPAKITDIYNGDFNKIKNNLNQCIDILNGFHHETNNLITATKSGKLDTRGEAEKFPGGWGTLVRGINELIDAFVQPINITAEYIDRISKGEVPAKITDSYDGDFNEIKNNLNQCIDVMNGLLTETNTLIMATKAGQLDTRGAATNFPGDWGRLVSEINDLIDAFVQPIHVTAEYIDRISKGDIPTKITDSYDGDFNEIKNNLNQCIDALSGLITDMNHMSSEHDRGDIDVMMNPALFHGAYQEMAEGINKMVSGHIAVKKKAMACVKEFGKGNFDAPLEQFPLKKAFINDTIEQVRTNLKALISDTNLLIKAAKDGHLDTRADPSLHEGDFRKIIEGFNDTLDAVIGPLNIAAEYVDRISKGEIPAKITDTYNGDFNEIKNNLNQCIDALSGLITDMNHMSFEHDRGDIDVMMDSAQFQGAYQEMAKGINKMVSGHIAVKKKAMACIKEFGQGNFDAPLEQFPLKKAFINDTIEQVRANLKAVIVDTNKLTEAAVDGKLRTRADATKHQGDFRKIVEGINSTLDAVIIPFRVVNDQISQIAAGSEEASASLEEVAEGAKEITHNSELVNTYTERCDKSLIQVLRAMEDFTVTVGQVSGKADSVSKISYATNQLCEEGTNVARKAEQGMEGITSSAVEINGIVTDIQGQMKEIGKIVNLISDISNQTNLLALNAAIEAARAGDAGRGFAVVAAEVKSLALESRKSAESIANMINGLQHKSQAAADAMLNADSEVKIGNVAMKETLAVFAKIVDSVGDISKNMEEVASASEEQAASVQEITASINEVSSLVKETAEEAQKSSNTTRDSTVAIDQISHVVGDLSGIAETLSSEIGRFEI
jgi:methyl-accepting chemotaxis protein